MTREELAKSPLKRGDFLVHRVLGTVKYARKIRGNPDFIIVDRAENAFMGAQQVTGIRINISEVERFKRGRGKQKARLLVAVCPDCNLKIRVTRVWLESGTPRCFNEQCPGAKFKGNDGMIYHGRALETEWEPQETDMRAVGKELQRDYHGRDVDFSDLDDDIPFGEDNGKA